ncbi:MAG: preprotein translocase subunit SecG [Candidatus Niyogibacteria bacterium]|nr:preprotein translocase subunit SecG [Candidatus Niyogibacteria bacterium]
MQILRTLLPYAQIGVAILLAITILLQQKGGSVGSIFGGGEATFYRTKRGLERGLFISTIILGIAFVVLAILGLTLR